MKEKSMTKQQPSATGSQLSKICRLLICFGVIKVALLIAMASGFSLPELEFFTQSEPAQVAIQDELNKDLALPNNAQNPALAEQTIAHNHMEVAENPQGSAAVLAAKQYNKSASKTPMNYLPETATTSASPVMPQKPSDDKSLWWNNLASLTSLPFPRLGLDQVAYAATLDSPPPPAIPNSAAPSPFSPPQQNPTPPAPAQPAILPAGTAGPQVGVVQPNPLVPNPNPPAPSVNAYVPPDDPMQKQQEIARREQELLMLKRQTEQRLKELQAAERKVQEMLKEAKTVEGGKVDALTNMYVNMKAKQAAKAIETMDEGIAVKILSSMKPKQAGEILSYTNPAKTAKLTEILSRMQLGK